MHCNMCALKFSFNQLHFRQTKSPLRGDTVTVNRVLDYLVNTPDLGLELYDTVDASYGTHDD